MKFRPQRGHEEQTCFGRPKMRLYHDIGLIYDLCISEKHEQGSGFIAILRGIHAYVCANTASFRF